MARLGPRFSATHPMDRRARSSASCSPTAASYRNTRARRWMAWRPPAQSVRCSTAVSKTTTTLGVSPRLGVLLNYSTTRILFISEPFENSITAIDLTDDGVVFRPAAVRRFRTEVLDHPVDLAPVSIETENPNWASNTTLDVGSDFYVANRGNNTIARMRQDGTVVAIREVRLAGGQPLGNARLNGIASSPDGTRIWVTVTGRLPGHGGTAGAVVELPAFP